MSENFGQALRRIRADRGISLRRLAELVTYDFRYLSQIERGTRSPTEGLATKCDTALQADGYLTALTQVAGPKSRGSSLVPVSGAVSQVPRNDAHTWATLGELVMAAAHESTERAAEDGGMVVPPSSVEQVQADVRRLAREYGATAPVKFLGEARRVRDLASRLADRTRRPVQSAELYLATGRVCGLMAVASFDLAVWPAAIEQARAAFVYAEMVDDRSLQAWARGVQALTAYWCGRSREAAELAAAGLDLAPSGTPRARLHSIAARAWSHLGDVSATTTALQAAKSERDAVGEAGTDELHDSISGEFSWGPSRQAMSAANALLRINNAEEAAGQAQLAIDLSERDEAKSLAEMSARVDLARAELVRGRLDASTAALEPVWNLPPEHRRFGIIGRLMETAAGLLEPKYQGSAESKALRERIADFAADSAPKALAGGGPA